MKIYEKEFLLRKVLYIDEAKLNKILEKKADAYDEFEIPKKDGSREICGLKHSEIGKELRVLQKNLCKNFFAKCALPTAVKGFVKGESYLSYLQPHIGENFFIRIDIKDFFPSFSEDIIKKTLAEYVEDEESLEIIFDICTVDGMVPQGAVTSPDLSNIIFAKMDQRITKYCQKIEQSYRDSLKRQKENRLDLNLQYTRYADDMLFSSNFYDFGENMCFFRMISNILKSNGFVVNRRKTIISKEGLAVNGYVIGDCVHLSRKKAKNIKKLLYGFKHAEAQKYKLNSELFIDKRTVLERANSMNLQDQKGKKTFNSIQEMSYYLGGCRAWLISFLHENNRETKNIRDMKKMITRIELILKKLEKLE